MSQPFTEQNKTAFSNTTFSTSIASKITASTAPSEWGQKECEKIKKVFD